MKKRYNGICEGTLVSFLMENDSLWAGDREGFLRHDGDDFYIETKNSGSISVTGYLSAYNIKPIREKLICGCSVLPHHKIHKKHCWVREMEKKYQGCSKPVEVITNNK